MKGHQIKCSACESWTSGKEVNCEHCGQPAKKADPPSTHPHTAKKLEDSLKPQLIEILDDDGIAIRLGKRVIQFGQIIFYGIIGFIVWASAATVG